MTHSPHITQAIMRHRCERASISLNGLRYVRSVDLFRITETDKGHAANLRDNKIARPLETLNGVYWRLDDLHGILIYLLSRKGPALKKRRTELAGVNNGKPIVTAREARDSYPTRRETWLRMGGDPKMRVKAGSKSKATATLPKGKQK